jgi:hypothetical protein
MRQQRAAAAMLLLAAQPSFAHRVDEYLQATLFSIEPSRIHAELRLSPGIAVLPIIFASIDTDSDGTVSSKEWQGYAQRVLRDLSLQVDGEARTPRLTASRFPKAEDMLDGIGEIVLEFDATPPRGGPQHKLVFENHHQSRIGAYLVNSLVSRDAGIRLGTQTRNYSQSQYQLAYFQTVEPRSQTRMPEWLVLAAMGAFVLILAIARLFWKGINRKHG